MKFRIVTGIALAIAAFTAPGAVAAHAAEPAQVPCTPGSNGRIYCNFWLPGNGISGGSPVTNGVLVGYLPKGRNWITCQQEGPQISLKGYPQYYNKWFAWTTAENGRQGWVNAVAGSGGANNGKFSSTPSCQGAHGAPY